MSTRATHVRQERPAPPNPVRVGFARGAIELRQFFRERDAVVFTFSMPVVLLVLLASIFRDTYPGTQVTAGQVFAAGMIAAGIMSATFITLGIGITQDRDDGTLKRLRGTPTPVTSYFIGKILLVLVVSFAEVAALLAVGAGLFGLPLPADGGKWLVFARVFLLGVVSCALLGIAVSSLPRSAKSASSVIMMPFIGLQFISGVLFNPIKALPSPMVEIGSVFPLKWMAQGFRSVFLPDSMTTQEVAGSWEPGRTALLLTAWCIGGLVLCLVTFRWKNSRQG
ncbi:ABC transporter permease [Streptomyces sp. MST-110588]|uniref:ABC transporter permease n=1 Tax=Streptomyces sp. MST-110588 TaxID=2833628 RepID=UPI001F5DB06C|nr:ABC transporter permease [Streptomyces sp. MST-110588]UNO39478.1 ABC transporter permease [Streptomyces sp. MST-110588]